MVVHHKIYIINCVKFCFFIDYNSLVNNKVERYETIDNSQIDYDLAIKEVRLEHIKKLLTILGFDGVMDKTSLEKNIFAKNKDKCINQSKIFTDKSVRLLFKLKKFDEDSSNKKFLGYINSLLSDYGIKIYCKKHGNKTNKTLKYSIKKTIHDVKPRTLSLFN